jgi:CDP-glycerol glycerophosphotransferase (TagB/SpsB family)
MIEDAIDRGDLPHVAIIYRPHPWGHGGHKGERLISHSWRHVVIDKSMRAYLQSVATGNKRVNLANYADTHDLLSCVDALVSPLSTIILEGALHGKPVLCLLAEQKGQSSFNLQKGLVHFKDMYDCPSILMAHDEAELLPKIGELIGHVGDAAFASSLRDACRHFVSDFDQPFSERIVDFVWQTTTTKVAR